MDDFIWENVEFGYVVVFFGSVEKCLYVEVYVEKWMVVGDLVVYSVVEF